MNQIINNSDSDVNEIGRWLRTLSHFTDLRHLCKKRNWRGGCRVHLPQALFFRGHKFSLVGLLWAPKGAQNCSFWLWKGREPDSVLPKSKIQKPFHGPEREGDPGEIKVIILFIFPCCDTSYNNNLSSLLFSKRIKAFYLNGLNFERDLQS